MLLFFLFFFLLEGPSEEEMRAVHELSRKQLAAIGKGRANRVDEIVKLIRKNRVKRGRELDQKEIELKRAIVTLDAAELIDLSGEISFMPSSTLSRRMFMFTNTRFATVMSRDPEKEPK